MGAEIRSVRDADMQIKKMQTALAWTNAKKNKQHQRNAPAVSLPLPSKTKAVPDKDGFVKVTRSKPR